jgi:hypothetical protein
MEIDLVSSIIRQAPMILGCALLVTAAVLKLGKEKGAALILIGAIGLFLLSLLYPILYSIILPKVVGRLSHSAASDVISAVGLVSGILRSLAVILIGVGTLLRPATNSRS